MTSDASLDGYPEYQQQAAKAFQTLTIVSSLAHGQSAPAEFAQHLRRRGHLLPGLEERRRVPQDHDRGAEEPARRLTRRGGPELIRSRAHRPHPIRATRLERPMSVKRARGQAGRQSAGSAEQLPKSKTPSPVPRRRLVHGPEHPAHVRLRLRLHRLLRLISLLQLEAAHPAGPVDPRPVRRHLRRDVRRAALPGRHAQRGRLHACCSCCSPWSAAW